MTQAAVSECCRVVHAGLQAKYTQSLRGPRPRPTLTTGTTLKIGNRYYMKINY